MLSDTAAETPWAGEGADLVVWLEVLEHHGLVDPRWVHAAIYRTAAGAELPEALEGRWVVEAAAMALPPPTSPAPVEGPENRMLLELCQVPDPDLVHEWMNEASKATAEVPFRRELWAEVDTVRPHDADASWGEIHVTRVLDAWALDRILSNRAWIDGQALLDKVVGASYRMVCRPLVDNGPPGRSFDGG